MSSNQSIGKKIYLEGEKGIVYDKVKSRSFVYEDNDGLVVIGNPSFITRDIEEQMYDNYRKYKLLDTEKDELKIIKEAFSILVSIARKKALYRKENYLEDDYILRAYINNLSHKETTSYLDQIERYEQIARITKFFSR